MVVTGVGAISPVGLGATHTFEALLEGRSGVGPVPFYPPPRLACTIAASARDFDPVATVGARTARRSSRFSVLCLAAAKEALAQAQLQDADYDPQRVATLIGVGMGGIETIEASGRLMDARGPRALSPYSLPSVLPNTAAGLISIEANAQGPCLCPATACASSAQAIGEGLLMLRHNRADAVICGGGEAPLTPLSIGGFAAMQTLSRRNHEPQRASRPFDRDRDGFVMGEGAAVLVLERREAAQRRGAPILGRLLGYATNADAHHPVSPRTDGEIAAACIRAALADAGIERTQVGYINAHGTSTPQNDIAETHAIKRALGDHAHALCVSSTKSMTGHLLGGAGALESVITLMAVSQGRVPPTINLDTPDPQCDLDYVPHEARDLRLQAGLSHTFAFGGHNCVLVFG